MRWVFDPLPASGARSGGDPTAFVFDANLETFVREVLQNSVDAQLDPDRPVEVNLIVDPVVGERWAKLREALGWTALRRHVEAAARAGSGTEASRFASALEHTPDTDGLVVLWIEDAGTTGLDGPESGGGRFAALCRDRLFSDKADPQAGGSFGLGKAVLWRFSRYSTVLFYSRPAFRSASGTHRLVVKAALPWHTLGRDEFSGEGWFGRPEPAPGGGHRAESVWDAEALDVLAALGRPPLPDRATGTRVGVIGFDDPIEGPYDADPAQARTLAAALFAAAERDFWPAEVRGRLRFGVSVAERAIPRPPSTAPWRTMLATYDRFGEGPTLGGPGDVVVRQVRVTLPKHRPTGQGPTEVAVDLVVRASHPDEQAVFELIAFRGAGMVVQRSDERRLASAVRPFHAMVVAGAARRRASRDDLVLDAFLRDAEPPSHDRWTRTRRLRDDWARGYGKALDALAVGVREALRGLVTRRVSAQPDGPAALRALFGAGRPVEAGALFRFTSVSARLDPDHRWQFEGVVAPTVPLAGSWTVRLDARVPQDGGAAVGRLVGELRAEGDARARVQDGLGVIEALAGTREVRFAGATDPERAASPVDLAQTAFELAIVGAGAG